MVITKMAQGPMKNIGCYYLIGMFGSFNKTIL
jgi:hypothetical protein